MTGIFRKISFGLTLSLILFSNSLLASKSFAVTDDCSANYVPFGSCSATASCGSGSYGLVHYSGPAGGACGGGGYATDTSTNCRLDTSNPASNAGSYCSCFSGSPTCTAIKGMQCAAAQSGSNWNFCMTAVGGTGVPEGNCQCKADASCTSGSPCWVPYAGAPSSSCTAPANGSASNSCLYDPVASTVPGCGQRTITVSGACPTTQGYLGCSTSCAGSGTCYTLNSGTCTLSCNAGYTLSGSTCVASGGGSGATTPVSFTSGSYTENGVASSTITPTPAPPNITLATASQNLGNLAVGYTSVNSVTYTFNGDPTVDATSCSIVSGGINPTEFSMTGNTCSATLAHATSCSITVKGAPTSTGARSATFTLNCTGIPSGSATATVNETGKTIPVFALTPATKDWSTIPAGPGPVQTVTVTNTGTFGATGCTPSLTDAINFTISSNGCATVPGSGSCAIGITPNAPATGGPATFTTDVKMTCTTINDPNYNAATSASNGGANYIATVTPYTFNITASCTVPGQYKPTALSACQCPMGYAVTPTSTEGGSACRPIVPSLEYSQIANATSDGFPVCGAGRTPVDSSFQVSTIAYPAKPNSSHVSQNSLTFYNYLYAADGMTNPNPQYLFNNYDHCVCNSQNAYYPALSNSTGANVTPATNASFSTINKARFAQDNIETISALSMSNVIDVGEVPLATDGVSNGFLGSVYQLGASACGCPNVNEVSIPIDPSNSSIAGTVCQSMLKFSDPLTLKYGILATYNPAIHASAAPNKQKFSSEAAVATVKLPSAAGGTYSTYKRRIWTCAPPFEPVFASNKITCVFNPPKHVCDDGTSSGTPSAVSANLGAGAQTGANGAAQFKNAVNKRLACCLNEFDPSQPNAFQKFDCVDNSANAYATFDALWTESIDGVPNAVALTNSSGNLMTGFYSLSGRRCAEYNEFKGPIQSAKVNQKIISGQQSLAAGAGAPLAVIDHTNSYTIPQPAFMGVDAAWQNFVGGKRIPTTADEMRECPVLVRAAIKTTCPGAPLAANAAYPNLPQPLQSFNDGTTTRCSVASQVDVYVRVEQIYEIAGMAKMATIDSVTDARQAINLPVSDMIKNKTAGTCPAGAIVQSDGTCAFQ